VPFDHDEDKNSEAYATRTNTLHELAMIVMAKCVVVKLFSSSLRDIAVNYGHVKGDEFHSY
jgi:hypothetical protein